MELNRLIQHPEEMNRETLYDLRALLALYPYYQTARLLMLQNLYLLHDPSFDEELRRAAIYISDRKVIFQMVEAAHYQLKSQNSNRHEAMEGKPKSDRTSSLIDHFLHSIPTEAEEREKEPEEKRKPTPADAAVDYVAYLMETETETEHEQPSRTIALIDDFIEEGGFKLHKDKEEEDQESEEKEEEKQESEEADASQDTSTVEDGDAASKDKASDKADASAKPADAAVAADAADADSGGIFTETLARIYIKQGKYERAYQIIDRLYKQHPQKSAFYIDQLRFLEKLMLNEKKRK
ncbi:MAG: tetratricopeptide repeat protein [Prevotella sp.]